ncbi:EamA family transporter RarD [Shewanella sp. SNU WT4]|uniref:EamA family transporter RarD n=1 Tax=Shewanella sp. SNU WT4 TaxID=2590015 RepID=UPI001125B775|nr:EamA family transporter RarD [Shewanella sp. SNU WT4]QDF65991.1 EamA family transporter RarD [Shewanella sp. SNU WT4]
MKTQTQGNLFAAAAFAVWGLLPLYYQFLPGADVLELLAYRLVFSVPVMLALLALLKQPIDWAQVRQDKRSSLLCLLASLIMCFSWYAFTWAITHDQVLAASLGFFINPLFAIALGVIFLNEKLTKVQMVAVLLAIAGISYQVWGYGQLPWIALVMSGFFALYGLCKKYIKFDSMTSVTLEAIWLAPIALAYLTYVTLSGQSQAFAGGAIEVALYIGSAPVTLVPLALFTLAVSRTSLTNIGLMQYIEPSLQFLLAVFIFAEAFDEIKLVSFSLIWAGLLLCTLDSLPWRQYRVHSK